MLMSEPARGTNLALGKLTCRNLWKSYGRAETDAKAMLRRGLSHNELAAKLGEYEQPAALADVSFSIDEGEIFVVMGLSGSGKSTLIRCLARLIEPTAGQVLLDGQDLLAFSRDRYGDARFRFPSEAELGRDEHMRAESDAGTNAGRHRAFTRPEWHERRGSRSAADQRPLSEVASADCEIRHDPPSAIVADDIERHVGGDGEVRRLEGIELAAQIGDLRPDRQSRRDEHARAAANRAEIVPDLVDEAAPADDGLDDRRGLVLREHRLPHSGQRGGDGQGRSETTHLPPVAEPCGTGRTTPRRIR